MRQGVSPTTATPTGFTVRDFEALFCPCWNPGLCGLSCSPVVPPGVFAHKHGTALSSSLCLALSPLHPSCPSPPLLSVWINVSSCNSLTVGLIYSSIFWQFWWFSICKLVVVLLLVVQGSKAYLTTPQSWLEIFFS